MGEAKFAFNNVVCMHSLVRGISVGVSLNENSVML